jgi:hypothetical protein
MLKPRDPLRPPPKEPLDVDDCDDVEARLDSALDDTFPASDPVTFLSQLDQPPPPPVRPEK